MKEFEAEDGHFEEGPFEIGQGSITGMEGWNGEALCYLQSPELPKGKLTGVFRGCLYPFHG
jgi:hypothetical protein